jgi:hypothetical protein
MNPIAIHQPDAEAPPFDNDPIAWLGWAQARLRAGDRDAIAAQRPARFEADDRSTWRLVRTDTGIELRPALMNGFLVRSPNPLIGAIQVGDRIVVELISTEGSWVGSFGPDELDLRELGRAMLESRHLPHDNLRLLFGAASRD